MRELGHPLDDTLEYSGSSECRLVASRLTLLMILGIDRRVGRVCRLPWTSNWAFFKEKIASLRTAGKVECVGNQ